MIRTLLMIAVAGFFLSLVTLSTAIAIGGPDVLARGAWSSWNWDWDDDDWDHRFEHNDRGEWDGDKGPQASREIPWSGSDTLELNVLADVTYRQADGPAKLVITGRKSAVELVRVDRDGSVYLDGHRSRSRLHILMTAPNVTSFKLNGSDRLVVEGYDHDALNLELSGASEAVVDGKTRKVELDISGSGEADLGKLATQDADVEISGSGEAVIAPTGSADLNISGSGEITLKTRPARLDTDVSGSGSVRQEDDGDRITPSPSPSPSPTPSASPSPRAART